MSKSRTSERTTSSTDRTVSGIPSERVRVGVLSFHNSKETKAILNAVAALGHEPVWLREENARTWLVDGSLQFDPDVDIVVNRLLTTKAAQPLEDLGVAASYAAVRPVLNVPNAVVGAMHKYGAAATLAAAGLDVPDAYMALSHQTLNEERVPLAERIVHKPAIGTNGEGMSLVTADESVTPQIARRRTFLQQFLETDADRPFDVRVYVVGGRIVGAMKRYAPANEWRTNVALGASVEDITGELPERVERLARRAVEILGLDYAGVDLLTRGERWYVLEVNATAGFKGLFEATGISPAPHIASLAIERAGAPIDAGRVAALAATFDDSVPACAPPLQAETDDPETIGYTESVDVSGGKRVQRVIAKVDTGAKRTSIDIDVASAIGVGPILGTTRVKSGTRSGRQKRPLVELDVRLGGQWHTTTASIEDRDHMAYPILLGRDILRGYRVDIQRRADEE